MATATETPPAPSLTFANKVLGIPLVSAGLDTIHSTLSSSPYTQRAYNASSNLAKSAYATASSYATASPLYPKVLPVLEKADGYANKGLDAVHSRFPYPFESSPEKVYHDILKAPEDAKTVAYKTIDERIKTPAVGIAKGVDSRLTPLVDLLETVLTRLHVAPEHSATPSGASYAEVTASSPGASTSTDKAQITRAKELVFGAKDHLIVLTTEQAKALRNQNVYIQRAADQAEALNAYLASQYAHTQAGIASYKGKSIELTKEGQARITALQQSVLTELEKIQSTTASFPAQLQQTFKPLTEEIGTTLVEVRKVLTEGGAEGEKSVGVSEKAHKATAVIREHIGPIVAKGKEVYAVALERVWPKKAEVGSGNPEVDSLTNGTS